MKTIRPISTLRLIVALHFLCLAATHAQNESSPPPLPTPEELAKRSLIPLEPPLLFLPQESETGISGGTLKPNLKRFRFARVNTGVFSSSSSKVKLNLFSDKQFTARLTKIEWIGTSAIHYYDIEESVEGRLIIAYQNGVIAGDLVAGPNEFYTISYGGDDLHEIAEPDRTKGARCGVDELSLTVQNANASDQKLENPAVTPGAGEAGNSPMSGSSGPIIDVLVLYTVAAKNGAGGIDGITSLVGLSVALFNTITERSSVGARLRLVGLRETSYVESGSLPQDHLNLSNGNVAPLNEVWTIPPGGPPGLRDQFGADLVSLFLEYPETYPTGGYGGCYNPPARAVSKIL